MNSKSNPPTQPGSVERLQADEIVECLNEAYCASLGSHQDRKYLSEAATLIKQLQDEQAEWAIERAVGQRQLDALQDELIEARRDQWQPIETAPKDGQTILVVEKLRGGDFTVTPGRWFDDEQGWWEHGSHPTDYADQPIESPTHWMPLPDPPTFIDKSQ